MLTIARQEGERIIVGRGQVIIAVKRIDGNRVLIGVHADKSIPIHREEVELAIAEQERQAAERAGLEGGLGTIRGKGGAS